MKIDDWKNAEWVEMEKSKRGWRKTFSRAFSDTPSSVVELITNSVDSYEEKYANNPEATREIIIDYNGMEKGPSRKEYLKNKFRVADFAMGIPGEKLLNCFRYHEEATSPRVLEGIVKSGGFKGVGGKDTVMFHAWKTKVKEPAEITTFYGKNFSQLKAMFDDENDTPKLMLNITNEPVTKDILNKYGMMNHENGTVVTCPIRSDIKKLDFEEFKKMIQNHWRLRKVLSSKNYQIILRDYYNPQKRVKLEYNYPEIDKTLLPKTDFEIEFNQKEVAELQNRLFELMKKYPRIKKMITDEDLEILNKGKFKISLVIYKSKTFLDNMSSFYRNGGILVYHNDYNVLDCTIFGWENKTKLADYMFGELEIISGINIFIALEDAGIELVDEKRKGLIKNHPLVSKIVTKLDSIINELAKKYKFEDIEEISGDKRELNKTLKEINSDLKVEINQIIVGPRNIEIPEEGLRFYSTYSIKSTEKTKSLNLKQLEPKGLWLAINREKIGQPDDIEIITDKELSHQIKTKHQPDENRPNLEVWTLSIIGEETCKNKVVKAIYKEFHDEVNVNVEKNNKLDPLNGFQFIPPDISITVDPKQKIEKKENIFLIFNENICSMKQPIYFNLKNDNKKIFSYPERVDFKKRKQIHEKISFIKIPIEINYDKKLDLPYIVNLFAKHKSHILKICQSEVKIIVKEKGERLPSGFLGDIKPDNIQSGYDDARIEPSTIDGKKTNILYIHTWHPTFNPKNIDIIATNIMSNAAARCVVKNLLKIKGFFEPEAPADEYITEFDKFYEKYGRKWQEAILRYIKTWNL